MTPANAERQRRSYDAKRLVYCCDLDGARAFSEPHFNLGRYICRIGRDSRWCRRGKFSWNSRDDRLDQFSRAARQRRADVSRRRRNRSPFAKSESARQRLIGILSFGVPFAIVRLFAQFVLGWHLQQAQIAGVALSTTSVAVVYAVMIEGGYSDTAMGKTILAACFITDLGTVLALGVLFANFNMWLVLFVVVMCVVLWFMPTWTQFIIVRLGATRVSEPEVKFIFFILFFLDGLATTAKSEAVLPAYLVGLVVAGVFLRDKTLVNRMRSIAFAIFTPFYFIKAGLYVSLPVLWTGLGIIGALLLVKMITKLVGVFPLARMHYMGKREASYTTLLMATGLTFGTISALFGLQNKIIDQRQYTILVSVVILSAFVPTLIAQKFFQPSVEAMHAWGRLYRKRTRVLSVEDVGDNGDMKNE